MSELISYNERVGNPGLMFVKKILLWSLIFLLSGMVVACQPASSEATLEWSNGWVRAMPPGSGMTAAYGELRNNSTVPINLTGFSSDSFDSVSLHQSSMQDGVSSMTEQGAITLQAHDVLVLEPGGLHLMLMRANRELVSGDEVRITLEDGSKKHSFSLPVMRR